MKRITQKTLLMFLLAGFIFQGCSNKAEESSSFKKIYEEKGLPVRVKVLNYQQNDFSYKASAVLTGIQESTASASVADRVEKMLYHVGDRVTKDDVVVTFPTDNPAARYIQARVNVEHMRTTLERMKSLYDSGGISRQAYDNVAAQSKVAEANWDAAQQTVQVRAPISGVITCINVQESDNVNPGDVLFTVARTEKLKARLWVSENQINNIHKGDKAVAVWNGIKITGSVSQVDLSLNSGNQAFGVQLEFDNSGQNMRAGVNAEIRIIPNADESILMIARKDLLKSGDDYHVFKLTHNKAVKQPVVIGRNFDLNVEILKGLSAGDSIITEGATLAEDGQSVCIVK